MGLNIAMVGGSQRNNFQVECSHADLVWVTSRGYLYPFLPRLDAIFELHPIWLTGVDGRFEYGREREHYSWLKQNEQTLVYMLETRVEIPMGLQYPIGEVSRFVFGDEPPEFSSTLDYMMGLAATMGATKIEVYGFELGSNQEYRYQRDGFAFYRGFCKGLGIQVVLPENTTLIRKKLYGFQGGQMVSRHDLERYRSVFAEEFARDVGRINFLNGKKTQIMLDVTAIPDTLSAVEKELVEAREKALISSGALQALDYLIKEVDLEIPNVELENLLVNNKFLEVEKC